MICEICEKDKVLTGLLRIAWGARGVLVRVCVDCEAQLRAGHKGQGDPKRSLAEIAQSLVVGAFKDSVA